MRPEDDDAKASASRVAIRTDQAPATASSVVAPAGRRPYRAPTIRLLGCVRDLTLGGASGFAEGAGSFIRPMM